MDGLVRPIFYLGSTGVFMNENDNDETDAAILAAAKKIFGERGFHDTVVVDVAEEAGVGKGTVYRRFGNKSDLFSGLVCEETNHLIERLQEGVDRSTSLEELVQSIITVHFDLFEESDEIIRIFVEEGLSNFGEWQEDVVERWTEFRSLMAEYFDDEQIQDQLKDDVTPEDCSKLIANLIWGTLRSIVIFEEEHPREVYEEMLADVLLSGVTEP
jgi:TetR/AcrR family fatty acid metabolism transcriptional regulator